MAGHGSRPGSCLPGPSWASHKHNHGQGDGCTNGRQRLLEMVPSAGMACLRMHSSVSRGCTARGGKWRLPWLQTVERRRVQRGRWLGMAADASELKETSCDKNRPSGGGWTPNTWAASGASFTGVSIALLGVRLRHDLQRAAKEGTKIIPRTKGKAGGSPAPIRHVGFRAFMYGSSFCVLMGVAITSYTVHAFQTTDPQELGDHLRIVARNQRAWLMDNFAEPLVNGVRTAVNAVLPPVQRTVDSAERWYRESTFGKWFSSNQKTPQQATAEQRESAFEELKAKYPDAQGDFDEMKRYMDEKEQEANEQPRRGQEANEQP